MVRSLCVIVVVIVIIVGVVLVHLILTHVACVYFCLCLCLCAKRNFSRHMFDLQQLKMNLIKILRDSRFSELFSFFVVWLVLSLPSYVYRTYEYHFVHTHIPFFASLFFFVHFRNYKFYVFFMSETRTTLHDSFQWYHIPVAFQIDKYSRVRYRFGSSHFNRIFGLAHCTNGSTPNEINFVRLVIEAAASCQMKIDFTFAQITRQEHVNEANVDDEFSTYSITNYFYYLKCKINSNDIVRRAIVSFATATAYLFSRISGQK